MGESLQNIENDININIDNLKDIDEYKKYLNDKIGLFYDKYIIINIYFIRLLILVSIEGGDLILFNMFTNMEKIFKNFYEFLRLFGFLRFLENLSENFSILLSVDVYNKNYKNIIEKLFADKFKDDFEKNYKKDEIEKINMKNVFYKNKTKNLIKSNISSNSSFKEINKMFAFSEYSEHCKIGEQYYNNFLEIFNNYSNDFKEDIEISIFDNLKEENNKQLDNFTTIKDMINFYIKDEESKKGFLALLRQSYLLGELRTNIVSIYFLILFYRKMNIS